MRTRAIAATVSAALALTFSLATAPASGQALSAERIRSREIRPNRYLLGAGAGILAAAYAPGVVVATTNDRKDDDWLYAPVIGPWADLAGRDSCSPNCGDEDLFRLLLITSGGAQVLGAVGIVASFIVPEYESPTPVAQEKPEKPEIRITPMQLTRTGYGLGVTGRF